MILNLRGSVDDLRSEFLATSHELIVVGEEVGTTYSEIPNELYRQYRERELLPDE